MVPETLPCIRNRNGLREKMKRKTEIHWEDHQKSKNIYFVARTNNVTYFILKPTVGYLNYLDPPCYASTNGRNARLKLRRQPTSKKLHHVTSADSRGRRLTT